MKKLFFSLLVLSAIIWGCKKDFVVADISKKTITINAPANNTETTLNTITFWWNALDGAEQYNLQIVKPDFTKAVQLLLDTNVTVTKYNFSFKPGNYQWRIKGINAGHSTAYQVFNIQIDTTSDLSEQHVNLLSPASGATIGSTLVTLSWSSISVAKKYRVQINSGVLLDTTLVGKISLTYPFHATQNSNTAYTWDVKAINDFSESQFNAAPSSFTVDLKGPTTPQYISPVDGGTITSTDTLKWKDAVDVKYDSLYVYYDSTYTNFDGYKVDVNYKPVSELALVPNLTGSFYSWKVRSFDAYGNASPYSLKRKFRVKP